jgi:hypothetical protein
MRPGRMSGVETNHFKLCCVLSLGQSLKAHWLEKHTGNEGVERRAARRRALSSLRSHAMRNGRRKPLNL